jgi:hypothetical protein
MDLLEPVPDGENPAISEIMVFYMWTTSLLLCTKHKHFVERHFDIAYPFLVINNIANILNTRRTGGDNDDREDSSERMSVRA